MRPVPIAALALAGVLCAAGPGRAAGPNGGRVVVAEGHPIEFVATEAGLTFYLADEDGRPLPTAGLSAKAYVTAAGRTETLALVPAAPNRLVADIPAPLPLGARVVLSVRVHGHGLQARFER